MPTYDTRILSAALAVLREYGYGGLTLARVAEHAHVDLDTLRLQFADSTALYAALITTYSPAKDLATVLDSVSGDTAEDILRDTMRRLVEVMANHEEFVDLAAIDIQSNGGASLFGMSLQLAPKALGLLSRLKNTGQLRPVSDIILARTLAAMLIGFIASERAMPKIARMAMRLMPQRAWLDGMVDLMLYGILEDNVR